MKIEWTKDSWIVEYTEYSYEDESNPDKIIHARVTYEDDDHEGVRWSWSVNIYTPPTPDGFQVSTRGRKMNLEIGHGYVNHNKLVEALCLAQEFIETH